MPKFISVTFGEPASGMAADIEVAKSPTIMSHKAITRQTMPALDGQVFISYNSKDRDEALELYGQLQSQGIRCFVDVWDLTPGEPWSLELKNKVESVSQAIVLLGDLGTGPIQTVEVFDLLRAAEIRHLQIIPVILKSCQSVDAVPDYLMSRTWVDLRTKLPDPFHRLLEALAAKRPQPEKSYTATPPVTHPLHQYPISPAVFMERIPESLPAAYGDLYADLLERQRLVAKANRFRIEANPDCPPGAYIRPSALPPANATGEDFWWEAFKRAGRASPRMLASLLLVVDPNGFVHSVQQERSGFLRRLETWK